MSLRGRSGCNWPALGPRNSSRMTIRLVALVLQGSGAANAIVARPPHSRCKVTFKDRYLVISSFVKSYPVLLKCRSSLSLLFTPRPRSFCFRGMPDLLIAHRFRVASHRRASLGGVRPFLSGPNRPPAFAIASDDSRSMSRTND
jgi:hypothetical protein